MSKESDNSEKQLKQFFDQIDVNKNGKINIQYLLRDMVCSDDKMKLIVEAAKKTDLDNDGNFIFEEFKLFDKYMREIK